MQNVAKMFLELQLNFHTWFHQIINENSSDSTEEDGQKISFLKSAKNVFFDVQNVLDPLLSLYVYLFIPKVLLKDQKMLNL